jgi:hypothetical protein
MVGVSGWGLDDLTGHNDVMEKGEGSRIDLLVLTQLKHTLRKYQQVEPAAFPLLPAPQPSMSVCVQLSCLHVNALASSP